MQPTTTSLLPALLALLTLASALPSPSSLAPRAPYCANAPKTLAGTKLPRTPGLTFSTDQGDHTMTWCAPRSATYIIVTFAYALPGAGLPQLLEQVSHAVMGHIQTAPDGPIPTGEFSYLIPQWGGATVAMHVWNVNNHQITWGVLSSAVEALAEYFGSTEWAAATFAIWDGVNKVGLGVVGLQPNS